MNRQKVRERIEEIGIIPGVRAAHPEDAVYAAQTLAANGISIVEITMTVPHAVEAIAELTRGNPDMVVGAGTVFDVETAARCVEAGASFVTSTGFDAGVVSFAVKEKIVVFPGALTPTEIIAAWKLGPDYIKIFPCANLGGPAYLKALKGPFPKVPLIASGGVNQTTVTDFVQAGVVAVGIGNELIPVQAIRLRQDHRIAELARRFLSMVKEARGAA
jgi:2-dehydro-3-deoxyphosphogluconate aldolase/(4S)-4-hydroxy-2-oxoglutarate aldolase